MYCKRILCAAMASCIVVVAAGCAALGFDAKGYVKACLDFLYLGQTSDYMKLVDITAEEAEKDYEAGVEVEMEMLLESYECQDVSDATRDSLKAFYKNVYQKSKYEILSSKRVDKDTYSVELSISPLDIFKISEEAQNTYVDEFIAKMESGEYDALSEQEFNSVIIDGLIGVLSGYLPNMGYTEAKTITVSVIRDSSGTWGIPDEDAQSIDELIINYE